MKKTGQNKSLNQLPRIPAQKKLSLTFIVIIYVKLLLIFLQWITFHHFFNIWRFMIMKTTQIHDIIFICRCCAFAFIAFSCTTPKNPISFLSVPSINVISLVYQLSSSKLRNWVPLDFLYIVQIWKVEEKINEIESSRCLLIPSYAWCY